MKIFCRHLFTKTHDFIVFSDTFEIHHLMLTCEKCNKKKEIIYLDNPNKVCYNTRERR